MKEESRSQASGLAGGLASGLEGHFEYSTDQFDADTIEEMRRRFEYLLEVLTRNPDLRLLDIPLDPKELPEDDRELFVHEAQGDNQAQFVFD
jgi:non-ribosomal peptide synthetase component F